MPFVDDRQRCAHLLRRFGLGSSEAELDFYLLDGLHGAADKLLEYDSVDEGFGVDPGSLRNPQGKLNARSAVNWWTMRLLMTRRPLQERMTLFWHNHFATSAMKVGAPMLMIQQNETLRANATGSFRKLLSEVAKSPAMIVWLDGQENVKDHANENFAREVMELFTLGIGHYTESDVQEGARAFTGWGLQRDGEAGEFVFRPARHDDGSKSFLGHQGSLDGDDVLNILCDHPRTAEFLVTKIWDWFVWPKPDPQTVAPFVQEFRDSGLDIKKLLRSIMTSKEFYSAKAERAIVKSPVDFCVVTMRELGKGDELRKIIANPPTSKTIPRPSTQIAAGTAFAMRSMGMWLMYPPDVHGWDNGRAWITSQTMLQRVGWSERLFGGDGSAWPHFLEDPTPDGVVRRLVALLDANMKPEHQSILKEAARKASGDKVTEGNANATAIAVARLMFASPVFQVC